MGLRKNVISNVILTSSNVLFPLITFPYVTHILSNESYGRISFTDAFTSYFLTFATIGIPFYGVREIAKVKDDPEKYSKLVVELVGLQFCLAVFFSIVFLIMQNQLHSLQGNFSLVKIACIIIISTSFSIEWFFQGVENFGYITSRSIFTKALNVGSIFLFVKNPNDFNIYYLISALTIFVNATWNFTYFLKRYYKPFTAPLSIKPHIRPLLVLFSINISISIYTVLDTIILGLFTDPATVSLYTVPLRLVKMFWTVVGSIGVVLIPRMANLFVNNDREAIIELIKKSSNIVFLLTIPFAGFGLMFPGEILLMISGDKYLQATDALRVLSLVPLIIGICNVLGSQYLMPIGQENRILHATIVGLVISLALNFALIPHFKHLGASIACIAAELAVCVYIYVSAKKRITIVFDKSLLMLVISSMIISSVCGVILQGKFHPFAFLFLVGMIYFSSFLMLQFFVFKNHFLTTLFDFKKLNPFKAN
jgi:O-antigen/teichoic acid export membrane protein